MSHHLVIAGGGNTGSQAVPLIARLPGVGKITLIDPDVYESKNVANQAADSAAVGRPKVDVLCERIHDVVPGIEVATIRDRVETVPLGALRGDLLCSCVDNRTARQHINEAACRLAMPWIDCAVGAPSLARVDVYRTSASTACMECAWDQAQYDALPQRYACEVGMSEAPATGATAELGAVAASLLANEARKLLADRLEQALIGRQLMLDLDYYTRHLCEFRRNPECRFDHQRWSIEMLALDPPDASLDALFAALSDRDDARIRLTGHRFVTHLDCNRCGRHTSVGLAVLDRIDESERSCACGGRMLASGFYTLEALPRAELSQAALQTSIDALGLSPGDVVSVDAPGHASRHVEIVARTPA